MQRARHTLQNCARGTIHAAVHGKIVDFLFVTRRGRPPPSKHECKGQLPSKNPEIIWRKNACFLPFLQYFHGTFFFFLYRSTQLFENRYGAQPYKTTCSAFCIAWSVQYVHIQVESTAAKVNAIEFSGFASLVGVGNEYCTLLARAMGNGRRLSHGYARLRNFSRARYGYNRGTSPASRSRKW